MTTKWLSRALLGGAAIAVATTGAQAADDLSALKAQLEALQSRVNQLEARPAAPSLPEGASWITFQSGSAAMSDWRPHETAADWTAPDSGGFTIGITPSADMPAPVHEVTIGGYVKGDVIYDFNQNLGDTFGPDRLRPDRGKNAHVRLHARQSRFNIRSRSDTAIGQIRTLIEGDFFGGANVFRLRHAWGEWDMTPNLTLGVGQFWDNWYALPIGVATVDFGGPLVAGAGRPRVAQVRMTYHAGPSQFAVAIADPTGDSGAIAGVSTFATATGSGINTFKGVGNQRGMSDRMPDITARWQYSASGGHLFHVAGILRHFNSDADATGALWNPGNNSKMGYGVNAGANINLADMATLSVGGAWGKGIADTILHGGGRAGWYDPGDDKIKLLQTWQLFAGVGFNLTDTTSFNVGWGMVNNRKSDVHEMCDDLDDAVAPPWGQIFQCNDARGHPQRVHKVHANILWRPVRELQLGWEVLYGHARFQTESSGNTNSEHAVRGMFGAWFFF